MDHSSKISEKELAELCARSDSNALKTLYFRYAEKLNALCYRYVSDEDDARDLTHDVMIHVYGNIHKFRWSGEGSLGGWIRRIAVNLSIDRLRRQNKTRENPFQNFCNVKNSEMGFLLSSPPAALSPIIRSEDIHSKPICGRHQR